MPDGKPYWTELLEPIDPALKTPYKLLASIAVGLKRLADQGDSRAATVSIDVALRPGRASKERTS